MKNLEFDPAAFEDLAWWIENDRKQALRTIKLVKDYDDLDSSTKFSIKLHSIN